MNRTLLYLIASTASTLASTTSCRVCSRETDVLAGPCDASAPEVEAISRAGVFWGEGDRVRRRLAVALRRHPDVGLVSCRRLGMAGSVDWGLHRGWAGFWPVQYFGGLPLFKRGAAACHDWNATLKWDASAALSPAELEHVARHGLSRFGCEGQ